MGGYKSHRLGKGQPEKPKVWSFCKTDQISFRMDLGCPFCKDRERARKLAEQVKQGEKKK